MQDRHICSPQSVLETLPSQIIACTSEALRGCNSEGVWIREFGLDQVSEVRMQSWGWDGDRDLHPALLHSLYPSQSCSLQPADEPWYHVPLQTGTSWWLYSPSWGFVADLVHEHLPSCGCCGIGEYFTAADGCWQRGASKPLHQMLPHQLGTGFFFPLLFSMFLKQKPSMPRYPVEQWEPARLGVGTGGPHSPSPRPGRAQGAPRE